MGSDFELLYHVAGGCNVYVRLKEVAHCLGNLVPRRCPRSATANDCRSSIHGLGFRV